jgi:hypothetical protein
MNSTLLVNIFGLFLLAITDCYFQQYEFSGLPAPVCTSSRKWK